MIVRKTAWLLVLMMVFSVITIGQTQKKLNYVEGELLVQLHDHASLKKLLSAHQSFGLAYAELISARFNIYLLKFDQGRASNQSVLRAIKVDDAVINAQNNHFVSIRGREDTIPNDSLFYDQWSLENTGQFDGTPGADIHAKEAWNVTTGGITSHGDTIVIAVIDGGSDLNHEDLYFWKNRAEIPNNGIDDDTNGYIDDYDGWNAYEHNGVIPIYNHGVHVTGIAAARGNNGIGIAGVNWNVKTLPVAGSSHTEAIVVEALSYIYVVRERYDQTGGEEGAFIVADNCSFGVNNGQPEDYPIWEAMYDSLGSIGILSIGATANSNVDVDEVGDIPTTFTTDFMITVTNTDRYDEKYSNAAYGDTAIDLGAPGTYILSCRANNRYGFSSGTSMSAPHVSGVVALLFAYADSTYLANYKNQPAEYALQVKDFILGGVDTINDLLGKTVTGGRLNAFKSLSLMADPPEPVPEISTNRDSIYVELLKDTSVSDSLLISNTGGDTLYYSISIAEEPEWLTLSQTEGILTKNEQDKIYLLFNAIGLDTGSYQTSLLIEGEDVDPKEVVVDMFVFTDVGVNENNRSSLNIVVYPNPFSSEVFVQLNGHYNRPATVKFFNQAGQLVYTNRFEVSGQEQLINLDYGKSGIYYYQIFVGNKRVKSGKLVRL